MMLNGEVKCAGRSNVIAPNCCGMDDRLKFFFVVLLCCICIHVEAALSSITVTASVPQQSSDFSDMPVTFQKFDPSQGKLASIEILLQGNGQLTQEFENRANSHNSARVRQTLLLNLTMPDANKSFLSASQTEKHKYAAGPYDGVVDFDGTSGETDIYDVTASNEKLLRSRKDLAMFTGSDLVEMFLSSDSFFHISSGKNAMFGVEAMTGADITIIYNYTSVPEPVWYGLLAGALALIGALRLQARNSGG